MTSADPFSVRRLGPSDEALAAEMNALFADAFEDNETYQGAPPEDPYLARLLASDNIVALVAHEHGGAIIGALVAYELRKFERRRSEFYLYDLAVSAAHRRRGVATALIARLRGIAAERGAWVVFVQADNGDVPAITLYEKLGVREDVLHFDIPPG